MHVIIRISDWLEKLASKAGKLAAWTAILLMLVILSDVILRRYFVIGSTRLQELEWHLHGTLFLMTLGFAYVEGAHVRIELLRERWSERTKIWVELVGCLLLFLPFCLATLKFGLDYAAMSFANSETSPTQTGLPMRWIIKYVMVLGFLILTASGVSVLLRSALYLFSDAKDEARQRLTRVIEDHPETP